MPGSCVHLPGWLISQDFPEVESPAGFGQVSGPRTPRIQRVPLPVRFTGPAQRGRRPKNRSSNSQRPLLWSSHPQGLLRGLFSQVSLRLPPAVSPQRGSLPSRSQRLRRACLRAVPRIPRSPGIAFQALQPAGSRTLSSTPLGAQRDVALDLHCGSTRPEATSRSSSEVDSSTALAFNDAEVRAWIDNPLLEHSKECEGNGTNSQGLFLHGRPGGRSKWLVRRLRRVHRFGLGRKQSFRVEPPQRPRHKTTTVGHRQRGLTHAQHHIPVQHTYTVHCATARCVSAASLSTRGTRTHK